MGSTKESFKPSTASGKSVFDKLASRFKNKKKETPKNVADLLVELETKILNLKGEKNYLEDTYEIIEKITRGLDKLIATKESELENEEGREDYNSRTAARLKVMEFHMNELAEILDMLQSSQSSKKNMDAKELEIYKKFSIFLVSETIERAAAIGADH